MKKLDVMHDAYGDEMDFPPGVARPQKKGHDGMPYTYGQARGPVPETIPALEAARDRIPFGEAARAALGQDAADVMDALDIEHGDVAPPGREEQVKALKKKGNVENPFAVAWASYNKGDEMGEPPAKKLDMGDDSEWDGFKPDASSAAHAKVEAACAGTPIAKDAADDYDEFNGDVGMSPPADDIATEVENAQASDEEEEKAKVRAPVVGPPNEGNAPINPHASQPVVAG